MPKDFVLRLFLCTFVPFVAAFNIFVSANTTTDESLTME